MTVYQKLQAARIKLQNTELKKSGHNKFAGYTYFELGDFLPAVQTIFAELGLCGCIAFTSEMATLRIVDVETGQEIVFTSPMAEANLKGCHPIQNLGASETYQRRYLWVTAMEIVEHDALDATTGSKQAEPVAAPQPVNLNAFKKRVDLCKTEDELRKLWRLIAQTCNEAGDVEASNHMKDYCAAHKAMLKEAEETA